VYCWIPSQKCCKKLEDKFVDKFTQVIELNGYLENRIKQGKSHRNKGMALFCLLEDIPNME
jgi:hypothetical protein